ncbi:hypothetical protein [Caulobacter sp. DWR1-3-2b1]|uniref:hypothetical protein n=1 Tax=Caulobacter sp. DWR1-3-2b1 TaxID=2804670 RepID=UPI003CFA6497
MNRVVANYVIFALSLTLALSQTACASAQKMVPGNPRVVLLDANAKLAVLTINGIEIFEGSLRSQDDSTGISKIVTIKRSEKYDIRLIVDGKVISDLVPGGDVETIYISPSSKTPIKSSNSSSLLID